MRTTIATILVVLAGLAACGGSGADSPEEVVQQLYELSMEGSLEDALALLVVEKRGQEEAYLRILARLRDDLNARHFSGLTVNGTNEEGNTIRVYLTETYESGETADGGAQTMLEDGEWKIKSLYVPGGIGGRGGRRL